LSLLFSDSHGLRFPQYNMEEEEEEIREEEEKEEEEEEI
jgi:hypothetical protein